MMGRRHSLFKKVLIGYDGSTQADTATETALAPIGKDGCRPHGDFKRNGGASNASVVRA